MDTKLCTQSDIIIIYSIIDLYNKIITIMLSGSSILASG